MQGKIRAEWDHLKRVVIRRPGIEMFLGLIEPFGSLYERAFSRKEARREHELLEHVLKHEFKIEVLKLEDQIVEAAARDPRIKKKLVELAHESISYQGDAKDVKIARQEFYRNVDSLDEEHFFTLLLLHPLIELEADKGTRNISLGIMERQPLSNIYFMRDQQFVTDKGIVMCRMAKPSRRREPSVTKFLWEEIMGLPILHETQAPGTIEGGEFIPMGDFALVGIGDRTNRNAINQLLDAGMGYKEVGVVHQARHPLIPSDKPDPMINMHLDTYFNVASSKVVVACEMLIKEAKVEIYKKKAGKFVKHKEETNLLEYITKKGFDVINITTLEQMSYASNFLCVRDGRILAIEVEKVTRDVLKNLAQAAKDDHERYGKLYEQAKKDHHHLMDEGQFFPHKKEIYQHGIDAYPLVLENLTGGYGGAHCMTCALERV